MSTLLMRLAGPMQSWGTQSRFVDRDTGREPSKSGVIGLLCAALGKPREEKPGDGFPTLAQLDEELRMGVRVDREGTIAKDYHTAGGGRVPGLKKYGVIKANGGLDAVVTTRYYLADADFLVGLEGDAALLRRLDDALARPVWPQYLGRKSFVPGIPVMIPDSLLPPGRLIPDPLEVALRQFPWLVRRRNRDQDKVPPTGLRMLIESSAEEGGEVRLDAPSSFVPADRRYILRYVKTSYLPACEVVKKEDDLCIFPD